MGAFGQIANENYSNIDLNKIFKKIFSKEDIEKYIIESIAMDLYYSGTTGNGKLLQTDTAKEQGLGLPYSKKTILFKEDKNQPTNRVTLRDTGEFDYSMYVDAGNLFADIKADFEKNGSNIYDNFKHMFKSFSDFENSVLTLRKNRFLVLLSDYVIISLQKELIKIHTK